MAKKTKAAIVDLDALLTKEKISSVSADEMTKIRETKSDNKKLPSLTARNMAEALFKNPAEGRAVDVKHLTAEQKESVIRTFKKELMRWAKHQKKDDLRVKYKDQTDRVIFEFQKKKDKTDKKGSSKKKAKNE